MKTLIFDFDGTIGDTLHVAIETVNGLSEKYGFKPLKNISHLRDCSMTEIVKSLHISFYRLWFFEKDVRNQFQKQARKITLFPGMKQVITKLKKFYKIGIITSNKPETIITILNKYHCNNFSFFNAGSSTFLKHRAIKKVLATHNINKEDVIYIGDEVRDVNACKKVGIKMIAVTWGWNSKKALAKAKPDIIVDKPQQLLEAVKKL